MTSLYDMEDMIIAVLIFHLNKLFFIFWRNTKVIKIHHNDFLTF